MKKAIKCIIIITACAVLLIRADVAAEAVTKSLKTVINRIIPSIFPFMVLSEIMISSFCNTSSNKKNSLFSARILSAVVLGNISGFPVGAKNSAKLCENGILSQKQALLCAIISGNAGVSFVISFVGANLFSNKMLGLLIYVSQFAASLFSALAASLLIKEKRRYSDYQAESENSQNISFSEVFIRSVSGAALSSLTVGAFITTFGVIIEYVKLFTKILTDSKLVLALVSSVLEISNGCLTSASLKAPLSYVVCSFCVGFSGLSVIFQSIAFLKRQNIKSPIFISFKFLQGVLSALITFFALKLLPDFTEVSASLDVKFNQTVILSYIVLIIFSVYLLQLIKKFTLKSAYRKERT